MAFAPVVRHFAVPLCKRSAVVNVAAGVGDISQARAYSDRCGGLRNPSPCRGHRKCVWRSQPPVDERSSARCQAQRRIRRKLREMVVRGVDVGDCFSLLTAGSDSDFCLLHQHAQRTSLSTPTLCRVPPPRCHPVSIGTRAYLAELLGNAALVHSREPLLAVNAAFQAAWRTSHSDGPRAMPWAPLK